LVGILKLFLGPRVVFAEEADFVDAIAEHGGFQLCRERHLCGQGTTRQLNPVGAAYSSVTIIWLSLFIFMSRLTELRIQFDFVATMILLLRSWQLTRNKTLKPSGSKPNSVAEMKTA